MKRYDFIAIGGGNAGLTAASKAAGAGRSAALIDRGPVGGLCSLNGCNPKKVLVRSTEVLNEIRHAEQFGISVSQPEIDWSRVIDRKESFTGGVTPATEDSLRQQGIDLIQGTPRFVSKDALEVNGDRIEFGAAIIATGSTPRPLEIEGGDLARTSNDILALRKVPTRLAVIGAGVVAMEFGQVFARLGSRVRIISPGSRALSGEDKEMVDALVEFSKRLGIEFEFQVKIGAIKRRVDQLAVEYEARGGAQSFEADFVLNAAGRVASLDGLDLEKAGVERDRRGVVVNEFLRSASNPDIFAAGDAHGRLQLSPVASYEGRVAGRNYVEGDVERVDYDSIPRAVYTIPPLASVGLTEAEARRRGLEVSVHTNDMSGWKVYAIAGEGEARSKIIVEEGPGRIIGAHIFGPGAGDLIGIFALAIKFGITADDLKGFVFAYPTFSSALPYTLG